MNTLPKLTDVQRLPKSGGKPRQLIVLVHGYGADGADLIGLADVLADFLPEAQFAAPNGPEPCVQNPSGRQWFPLIDRTPSVMLAGARRAAAVLNGYLEETLKDLDFDSTRLALVGFSQGTMTSLHLTLRRQPAIAALVGFSGAMVGPELLEKEIVVRPPVCLIHGQADPVVSHDSLQIAADALTTQHVPTETQSLPGLGHGIDHRGIDRAGAFLRKHLVH